MSDKIKEILETPIVPDELKPENIPELLEKRGGKGISDGTETGGVLREESIKTLDGSGKSGKKKIIRTICSYSAVAAACLLIVGGIMKFVPHAGKDMMTADMITNNTEGIKSDGKRKTSSTKSEEAASDNAESFEEGCTETSVNGSFAYVNAESYEQLFDRAKNAKLTRYGMLAGIDEDVISEEAEDSSLDEEWNNGAETDVYDTLRQVEGVAESDIIKANDRGVFYVTDNTPIYVSAWYGESVTYIPVDKNTGKFGEKKILDVNADAGIPENVWSDVSAMYLTDEKLTVIVSSGGISEGENAKPATTTVLTYDITGEAPAFSGRGVQSGNYSSSRMKDNILYLVTEETSWNFFRYGLVYDEEEGPREKQEKTYADTDKRMYVPFYGESYENAGCLDLGCIFIPEDDTEDGSTVMISGIDINSPESAVSSAAVSGYSGDIYCTADALYIQQVSYNGETDWNGSKTTFSKFALANGVISPVASGTVKGTVLNQFSMDEYNGYFRTATTSYEKLIDGEWNYQPSNNVFVLDAGMNVVGSITDIAPDETIKSVNFQGNTAYVVTYERTDPLFAIDLSDPEDPVITDEFKINGYSSFLWKWDEDHLLGFGVDATSEGIETGVKLVMFDVSDNGELKEDGYYAISAGDTYHSSYSTAVYDRKALLIDPEKNLIGFPLEEYDKDYTNSARSYLVFSYENGQFTEKGRIDSHSTYAGFDRGLYIGDHLYVFSHDEAVSTDLETMTETDRTEFDTPDNRKKNEETALAGE
ncbi:beta-propeller domain-containing protein [Ruminococcus sp. HUN007]|uniref:beta-propeller domain-containing protein n=1 Tax=Ruminococcus sp. HUN007 TaxID=1514668 RepID=UPI0005D2648C|nr:beta-propeller domain-containing protein [Ruminococcus sp. HUN007]